MILPVGFGSSAGGTPANAISRSLRFNSADSAYLNRTPASNGNRQTWTLSFWLKLGTLSTNRSFFGAGTNGSNYFLFYLTSGDVIRCEEIVSGAATWNIVTTPVYRDPSAWYHIVMAFDSPQATSSNRIKLYVNGVQVTAFSTATYPTQNLNSSYWNATSSHNIGAAIAAGVAYGNGYMTEINFIDSPSLVGSTTNASTTITLSSGSTTNIQVGWNIGGTNIPSGATVSSITNSTTFVISAAATGTGSSITFGATPPISSFGETDSNTGVWKPKVYTGTYGTNGFELNFSDNSNNTAATLGKDSSGNGNNWTPNNFSVTAGSGNDSLVDSPTSYGTDTGVGGEVRGNYCTWNPLDKSTNVTINNGNLDAIYTGSADVYGCFSTFSVSSDKWYAEFTATSLGGSNYPIVGIRRSSSYQANFLPETYVDLKAGNSFNRGSAGPTFTAFVDGDVLGIAFDEDSGKIYFSKNGTFLNSGNPVAGTGQFFSGLTDGPFKFGIGTFSSRTAIANFGQRAFAYTAPSGFKALCTQNFTTPTIGATSTTQANDYFNPVLYTGTGSSLSVTGVGFQPDLVWIKGRSGATDHGWYDAVRGVQKQLESNNTTAETTETTGLTAFGSDGFTVGALAQLNTSSATYVAWNWNAGGSNQTISVGQYATSPTNVPSIASTVRANTTSGFSIVTYTGNGSSGATIGHGLGAAPSFIIVKNRGVINKDWECYHISLGNTNRIRLNVTAAADTGGTMWANTSPTSTVFSVGSDADVNASTNTYVAYCFAPVAGYSAFGSYTGNNSTDGPFIYTGFRPAFVLVKATNTIQWWTLLDSKRDTYNVSTLGISPNSSDAESTFNTNRGPHNMDFVSNGFKIRTDSSGINGTNTFIYAAFAETPAKFSLAR